MSKPFPQNFQSAALTELHKRSREVWLQVTSGMPPTAEDIAILFAYTQTLEDLLELYREGFAEASNLIKNL